jgi:hypothetical protein
MINDNKSYVTNNTFDDEKIGFITDVSGCEIDDQIITSPWYMDKPSIN